MVKGNALLRRERAFCAWKNHFLMKLANILTTWPSKENPGKLIKDERIQ